MGTYIIYIYMVKQTPTPEGRRQEKKKMEDREEKTKKKNLKEGI
jgi:hypothetical protein